MHINVSIIESNKVDTIECMECLKILPQDNVYLLRKALFIDLLLSIVFLITTHAPT